LSLQSHVHTFKGVEMGRIESIRLKPTIEAYAMAHLSSPCQPSAIDDS
jgi:hypothetical protein